MPLSDGVESRAVYLATEPDPVFAMLHMPASMKNGATGVLLCPPLSWEDMCTYRTRRAWASALARAGYPALRIDLPGTGDSAGAFEDPSRLDAWTGAIKDAASWLRGEMGCARVVGIGIGFGGTLAWLAASRSAPIDDLVLWAVPTHGRRLMRETRASALLDIDTRLELDGLSDAGIEPDADRLEEDAMLDQAGMILTKETIESLEQVDLTKVPLADAPHRHVLLLQRPLVPSDETVRNHFEGLGVQLTVGTGDEYGAMMRYARFAEIPQGAIAQSISWLSDIERAPRLRDAVPSLPLTPVPTLTSLELLQDGVTISERPITFEIDGNTLFGIVTEPTGTPTQEMNALFFNNGADRRLGPNRMWVQTARRWAALGVRSVRFDHIGIGDSDGDEHFYDDVIAYYTREMEQRTPRILDRLATQGLSGPYVLVGLCSSAYWSFHGALDDPRVVGTFTVNLPFFFSTWWGLKVNAGWITRRKRRPEDGKAKVAFLWLLKRFWPTLPALHRLLVRARRGPSRIELALGKLRDRGIEVLLLVKPGWPLWQELHELRHVDVNQLSNLKVRRIPGYDSRLRPLPTQRFVNAEMDAALARVLASNGHSPPSALKTAEGG